MPGAVAVLGVIVIANATASRRGIRMSNRTEPCLPASPGLTYYRPPNVAPRELLRRALRTWLATPCKLGHAFSEMPDGWVCCRQCFKLWSPED
jgi:hypothetical protein